MSAGNKPAPGQDQAAAKKVQHTNDEFRHPSTWIPDTSAPEYPEVEPGMDNMPEGDNAKG